MTAAAVVRLIVRNRSREQYEPDRGQRVEEPVP